MSMFESSNPALSAAKHFNWNDQVGELATVNGVVEKTAILTALAAFVGGLTYAFVPVTGAVLAASCVASALIGIGIAWKLRGSPDMANILAPAYSIVEGVFLGVMTHSLDFALMGAGVDTAAIGGSLALPALIITISCATVVLGLNRVGILKPTQRFKSVVMTLTAGVMLAYLAMFVLSFFGVQIPFLSISSAFEGGQAALIGLGLNAAILVLASLWLVIDLGEIEGIVQSQSPKQMEWYGAFIFMVTLTWIYYEAVKLAFRLAMLFSGRRR